MTTGRPEHLEHQSSGPAGDGSGAGDLDEEILSELFALLGDGSPDGLLEVFRVFLASVPARLADAEAALADARLEDVSGVAHSLRGAAGAFGARGLGRLAGRLEQVCGEGDAESAHAVVEEMRAEFAIVKAVFTMRIAAFASDRTVGGVPPDSGQ